VTTENRSLNLVTKNWRSKVSWYEICALLEQWKFLADVSGQPFGPICKGQKIFWYFTLWDRTDRFTETTVRNCHYTLRDIPEEGRSHLIRGGSLKSYISLYAEKFEFRKSALRETNFRKNYLRNFSRTAIRKTRLRERCRVFERSVRWCRVLSLPVLWSVLL
jgi:hypothetical protein